MDDLDAPVPAVHATAGAVAKATAGGPATTLAAPGSDGSDPAAMSAAELTCGLGTATARMNAAIAAAEAASGHLNKILTECIARRVLSDCPDAETLHVRFDTEMCDAPAENADAQCYGHEEKLVVTNLLTADGDQCESLDLLSPVHYWLERLTEHLDGPEAMVLELATREWGYACSDECEEDGCDGGCVFDEDDE